MFATIDEDALFYQRYGRGSPVLVLHGGPGLGHAYFRPYLDALGQCAELIYFDQRGNGRSRGRDAIASMTLESLADDAEALRRTLKLGPCTLLGHGFGAFVAQVFARRYPDAVRSLVLVGATPALDYPARMLAGAREAGGEEALAAILATMTTPAQSDEAWRLAWRQALPAYFFRFQTVYESALADGLDFCAEAYNRALFELMPHFSAIDWLKELRKPALVVAGRHDWWAPVEEGAKRLVAGLPSAELAVFEHSGHYPFVEETTGFCHVVRRFLRQVGP